MSEAPTAPSVFCPKERKRVPIWYCLGSFMQKRERCPHMIEVRTRAAEDHAEVECDFDKEEEADENEPG